MEILNSKHQKRTILLIKNKDNPMTRICDILSSHYRLVIEDSSVRDYSGVKAAAGAISAAILCASDAASDQFELFDWIETDSMIAAVPMLIFCSSEQDFAVAGECLRRGAVDVITESLHGEFILNRIENAIRLKDSATFYEIERMLQELPSNIYLKDDKGRYIFATHYWHHYEHDDDPEWTIRGKTDPEIRKDKENAAKSRETDMEIIRTGKGISYVVQTNVDGICEYFEIIKRPVRDDQGKIKGIITLVNDVTEMELLRISLEEKAMKDELTGANNRRSFEQFLSGIKSSRQFPIAFISADCNDLKIINDTFGHFVGDEYLRMTVMLFRMVLPENSSVYRVGGDEFVLVLPYTDETAAMELIERMKAEAEHIIVKGRRLSVSFGAACLHEHGQDPMECLDIADQNMYAAKRLYKLEKTRE